jgi:uncharacterized protein with PIN domain/sulfur carrier protein ThiS
MKATLRFYAELNDFLPAHRRQRAFEHGFQVETTVKDMIEGLGVPHVEVDLILVNGEAVDFAHRVRDGDRISVFPVFESFDISATSPLRPEPLRETRFVLDVHLGRLASLLRLLGFDSVWKNDLDDQTLASISASEGRILLTRDRGLLKRSLVTRGYCVREARPAMQLAEVVHRFQIDSRAKPFSRCPRCNTELIDADASDVARRVPERVRKCHSEFRRCPGCDRVYWPGTHVERLRYLFEDLPGGRAVAIGSWR